MASRDVHRLFGLETPAPPRSSWHDRLRVRYEIQQLPPRPSSFSASRIQLVLGMVAYVASIALLAETGRAPASIVDATGLIMVAFGAASLVVGYPVGCSIFLKLKPITPSQIAAFAELSPPEVWRSACVELDKEMRSSSEPMSFETVRFRVAVIASRLAEMSSGQASEPRQRQIQAFRSLQQAETAEP